MSLSRKGRRLTQRRRRTWKCIVPKYRPNKRLCACGKKRKTQRYILSRHVKYQILKKPLYARACTAQPVQVGRFHSASARIAITTSWIISSWIEEKCDGVQTTKRELTAHSRYLMQRRPTSRCVAAILVLALVPPRAQVHNEDPYTSTVDAPTVDDDADARYPAATADQRYLGVW